MQLRLGFELKATALGVNAKSKANASNHCLVSSEAGW